jgi:sec-independent protein translocase protein TatA
MRLGFGEILIILVIALLVFGPSKLPQLGDALGKGIRNFKRASSGEDDEVPAPPQARPQLPAAAPGSAQGAPAASPERRA